MPTCKYLSGVVLLVIGLSSGRRSAPKAIWVEAIRVNYADSSVLSCFKISIPRRDFVPIVLNGNDSADQIKLSFARLRIREILSARDTITGIRFQFTHNTMYKSFYQSFAILKEEGVRQYIPIDNDIWFFFQPVDEETSGSIQPISCGTYP